MLMNSLEDSKDVLHTILVNELRNVYNIKYHKDATKGKKLNTSKSTKSRVFNVPLQNLQLTDAILVNGGVVQVPHFISDSCQKILDHAETEGIFRKAGSAQRLKEIRLGLENGKPISRTLNVIDLGDVLKSFFRDLPEPLLAPGMCQEMMLRCLLIPREEEKTRALLLTCLLLPSITLSTLSFFMQFLNKIASQSKVNRMTVQNLAIVFTPSLMPLTEQFNSIRLSNHVKVIEMLIENSMDIGLVPKEIVDQLSVVAHSQSTQDAKAKSKKRRSSSVTRFCVNGLKKIVNNVRRESVDNNLDGGGGGGSTATGTMNKGSTAGDLNHISQTPLLTSKKRKHIEIASMAESMGFSAKKKRDILPELLSTPLVLKEKKRRPSLISHFRAKSTAASQQTLQNVSTTSSQVSTSSDSPPPPPLPRRWSDATGTPRAKKIVAEQQQQQAKFMCSPVVSLPCLTLKESLDHLDELRIPSMNSSPRRRSRQSMGHTAEEDYVRIPKREYEAIKNRVSAIEKRISREFELVQTSKDSELSGSNSNTSHEVEDHQMVSPPLNKNNSGVAQDVQDKYQKALEETEELNRSTGGTDELAKRLGRDLKIRRSAEHKVMRSPSARKIGSIRRRSRDHKLNRTMSLNINTTATTNTINVIRKETNPQKKYKAETGDIQMDIEDMEEERVGNFYPRQTSNLKRGRPNTIQTGLRVHRSPPERRSKEATAMRRRSATIGTTSNTTEKLTTRMTINKPPTAIVASLNEFYPAGNGIGVDEELWTDAKDFFSDIPKRVPISSATVTPKRIVASERRSSLRSAGKTTPTASTGPVTPKPAMPNPEDNLLKTPMLPPKRAAPRKTPGSSMAKNHYLTPLQQAQQTGRASIARIRSQNAGMVLAKARLFNDLVGDEVEKGTATTTSRGSLERAASLALDVRRATQKENRLSPKTYVTSFRKPQIKPALLASSPRRGLVKTPSRERATPVRALPRSPRQAQQAVVGGRSSSAKAFHF